MPDISVVEVGPRDGLQNEPLVLSTQHKYSFVQQLICAGVSHIEIGSFVSAKAVPAMADTPELARLCTSLTADLIALVPNLKGACAAADANIKHIALFAAASNTFSLKNIGLSMEDALSRYREVATIAQQKRLKMRGYVSCIAGCPYEGDISIKVIVKLCKQLFEMGCQQVSLGDTVGYATPNRIRDLLRALQQEMPLDQIALHIHDTYGQALACVAQGIECGVATIDSAIAGLGGCPYAKGAAGNLATEDLLYFCQGQGLTTGIDLSQILKISNWLHNQHHFPIRSKAAQALLAKG